MSESRTRRAHPSVAPLVIASLLLLVLWAVVSAQIPSPSESGARYALVCLFLATFGALAFNVFGRLQVVTIGAIGALALGIAFRFYFPPDAIVYLGGKSDTLVLLLGVGVVTSLVEESGWFEVLASQILRSAGSDRRKVFVRLCVVTYVLSMFINNLATILVIIPISLRIADELEIDPVSLVLGEVVASNLGGASTMIGDFPNMLIATEIGLPFHMFLLYLAPVAMLQLWLMIVYLAPKRLQQSPEAPVAPPQNLERSLPVGGLVILVTMVLGFLLSGWAQISPALIAAVAAAAAFLFGKVKSRRLLRASHLQDAAFFACLFIMVGAVSATGILDGFGERVMRLWAESAVLSVIAIAWGAALVTCVLNAGPTTALLIHVLVAGAAASSGQPAIWWALSLGVCAGSSATLTGATAGPIAAGLLERHGRSLSFARFAETGLPLMLIFLSVSSIYLALLVSK